jgi:hypothetical protein
MLETRSSSPWAALIFAFIFGASSSLACYWTAGPSLDLLLGSVILAAIGTPPLCTISTWSFVAVALGAALVWLLNPVGWFACAILLVAFLAAEAGVTRLLMRVHLHPVAASAIVTTISLLWLTWPAWASPWLPGHSVRWLVMFHPLMAINTAASELGIWTEQRVAYRLTNLGQDVPYQLPTSIWPCVAVHAILAACSLPLAASRTGGRGTSTTPSEFA